ncbi:Hexosaminidase D, partial [Apaloderma vittatum]
NGILIEYEDMFPFKGELEILKSPYAYSEEDIERIQQLAELHKLEVVPLVQTFGHVEFILKHEKYQHLREVERFPNSFNPHVPDTLALLKSILSQVIEKHRRSTWSHIGADEVFHLGEGTDSKNWMSRNRGDTGTMFLNHIKEVLGFVAARHPPAAATSTHVPILAPLTESGIAKHVSPVVWFYAPDFEAEQIGKVMCPAPGAPNPPPSLLRRWWHWWLSRCRAFPHQVRRERLRGRFWGSPGALAPHALGSHLLVFCSEGRGAFPGAEIYHMVEQVNGHLKESVLKFLEEESAIKGWFSLYHRKRQFGNPRNMETFGSKVLKYVVLGAGSPFPRVFPDMVEEWMEENVNPYLDQLRDLVRDYR